MISHVFPGINNFEKAPACSWAGREMAPGVRAPFFSDGLHGGEVASTGEAVDVRGRAAASRPI